LGWTIYSVLESDPGKDGPGDKTQERFKVLNDRWVTLNNLREYQIKNTGTRSIIEQMVNADVPELEDDKKDHLNDLIDKKKFYTDILREKCSEFE